MRIAGIVLVGVAALLIVPPLGYAGFLVLTARDPYRIMVGICEFVAGAGGCIGAVGAMLFAVAKR
jgi:hypothetical protein